MPEALAETWIDFGSGLRVEKNCADDNSVPIAVPVGTELPLKPSCGNNSMQSIVERAGEWIRDLMH
jgi:hypothetical protein